MGDEWDEPSQRGGFGGNRGYRSQGNDGAGESFIEVESGQIGRLIGKGGSKIKELQEQSGARIEVPRDRGNSPTVQVELGGSEECVARARELINQLVSSAGSYGDRGGQSYSRGGGGRSGGFGGGDWGGQRGGGGFGSGGGGYGGQQRSYGGGGFDGDSLSDSITVDTSMVGKIIGKGGSRIRELQDQSGCNINVPRDRAYGQDVNVELSGDPAAISEAKRLIKEITSEDSYGRSGRGDGFNGSSQAGPSETIDVETNMVGRIIGRGGSKIRELQDQSGARINVPRDRASGYMVTVGLSGAPDSIAAARALIEEIVAEASEGEVPGGRSGGGFGQENTTDMEVSASRIGRVIGN